MARPMPRAAGRVDVAVGETSCLSFIARTPAPGTVTVDRKRGGVLLAATSVARTPELVSRMADVWPFVEEAASVLETTLVNYDAIDVVPVAVASVGTLEGRTGGMLLWGEGATPGVVRLSRRSTVGCSRSVGPSGFEDRRRYRDFLIAQGYRPTSAICMR
ncbi:MAG: hypothetical protein ACT4PO_02890 [Actinomycetota bacterium]